MALMIQVRYRQNRADTIASISTVASLMFCDNCNLARMTSMNQFFQGTVWSYIIIEMQRENSEFAYMVLYYYSLSSDMFTINNEVSFRLGENSKGSCFIRVSQSCCSS